MILLNDVPIKFRGETDSGELVAVNANTVRQLVGWDSAGGELYEGDELYHDYWYRYGSQRADGVKPTATGFSTSTLTITCRGTSGKIIWRSWSNAKNALSGRRRLILVISARLTC